MASKPENLLEDFKFDLKYDFSRGLRCYCWRYVQLTSFCEYGNKPSCSSKGGEFHYYLRAVLSHEERLSFMELSSFHPIIKGKLSIQFGLHIISKYILCFLHLTLYRWSCLNVIILKKIQRIIILFKIASITSPQAIIYALALYVVRVDIRVLGYS